VAASSISEIEGLNIEDGQIGAIEGINAFSHWQVEDGQTDGHNSNFGHVQKKLPMCYDKLLSDYEVAYEDAEGITDYAKDAWPYDAAWNKGVKLQVWIIPDLGQGDMVQLTNDDSGFDYIELTESSDIFAESNMCTVSNKIEKPDDDDDEKKASLSGIATAASALFLAVASIAF